jgi:parvulin-like peptidyl-prolyl isomerase
LEGGADFATLAIRSSDDPASNIRGGALGAFGRGEMDASFEGAAFRLPVNGLSPVVETPFGFHVIQRLELVEVRLGQVLVQWAGAQGSKATRSREEAKAQAEQALTRLKAGESLATVASQLSDGPTGPRGGDLGWFQKGQMVAVLDEAAFALQPGGVSGLIESPAGFHVLVRLAPPFTDSPGPSAPPGTPR